MGGFCVCIYYAHTNICSNLMLIVKWELVFSQLIARAQS